MDNLSYSEYVEALRATLKWWLDAHFKFETWVEGYRNSDDDTFITTMEEMGWVEERTPARNGKFWLDYKFDMRKLSAKYAARRIFKHWVRCSECGSMDEFYTYCDCNGRTRTPRAYEVEELIVECELTNLITDDDVIRALKVVWKEYSSQMHDQLQGVKEEIKDCLKTLKNPTIEDVLWANHLEHLNGIVAIDYGEHCGLPYELVERVSREGLEAVFGETILE